MKPLSFQHCLQHANFLDQTAYGKNTLYPLPLELVPILCLGRLRLNLPLLVSRNMCSTMRLNPPLLNATEPTSTGINKFVFHNATEPTSTGINKFVFHNATEPTSTGIKKYVFHEDLLVNKLLKNSPINPPPPPHPRQKNLFAIKCFRFSQWGSIQVSNKIGKKKIIIHPFTAILITNIGFQVKVLYMKYLYPFECEKMKLSNPAELQCAIDGNRREGRRSSYGMEYLGPYGEMVQPPLLPLQNLQSLQNFQNLQNLGNPMLRPQLNGNTTASPHPLASHDYLLGRGGSPPGSQEALLEATRLTMWKLYNQGLVGGNQVLGGGPPPGPHSLHNDIQEDVLKPTPPPHHPILAPPFPAQNEALNLHMKDECSTSLPGLPGFLQRPRLKSPSEVRERGQEEQGVAPPAAKRQAANEDPCELRFPPPSTPTPTPTGQSAPGANIKITSRGDGRNSDQSLVVSMEINGILYQGVLFAQAPRHRIS
ncbi:unnamed protein product, partial [Meganyctiphanes norvegica]